MKTKLCNHCKKKLKGKKYTCKDCEKYYKKYKLKGKLKYKKKETIDKICKFCRHEFKTIDFRKKYCSGECVYQGHLKVMKEYMRNKKDEADYNGTTR